jgi:glycosyltransferase involved in cell wall biosynthesis
VVFVGRLEPEKGVQLALDAASHAAEIPFEFAGRGSMASIVESESRRLPNVVYHGEVSPKQVIEIMKRARLALVLPTWAEPFGRTAMEAMACGTPVIATVAGALPEVLGRSGWLVPATIDGPDLAERVRQLCALSPEQNDAARAAAREEYERRFSGHARTRELLAIYEEVVENRRT